MNPVWPGSHCRRIVGRIGGRGRGRPCRYRAWHRHRRLGAHSRGLLRPVRIQAQSRPHPARWRVAAGAELRCRRLDDARPRLAADDGAGADGPCRLRVTSRQAVFGSASICNGSGNALRKCRMRSIGFRPGSRRPGSRLFPSPCPAADVTTYAHAVTVLGEATAIYPDWKATRDQYPQTAWRALAAAQGIAPEDFASAREDTRIDHQGFRRSLCAMSMHLIGPTLPVRAAAVGVRRIRLNGQDQPIDLDAGRGNMPRQRHRRAGIVAAACIRRLSTGQPANFGAPQSRRSPVCSGACDRNGDRRLSFEGSFCVTPVHQACLLLKHNRTARDHSPQHGSFALTSPRDGQIICVQTNFATKDACFRDRRWQDRNAARIRAAPVRALRNDRRLSSQNPA